MLTLRAALLGTVLVLAGTGLAPAIPVSPEKNTAAPVKKAAKKPDAPAAAPAPPPNPLLEVIRKPRPEPVTPPAGN